MIDRGNIRKQDGVTLIELMIVVTIIGILSWVGIPGYGRFMAKSKVRSAANELLQNMRLAKSMAIKENREYEIIFDYAGNRYRIGFDGDGDGMLDENDPDDGYGSAPVRVVELGTHGEYIVIGSINFTKTPDNGKGPTGLLIADAASFQFNPDGTAEPNELVYFQYNADNRAYIYCIELANTTGVINLHMWQGDADNTHITTWTELR